MLAAWIKAETGVGKRMLISLGLYHIRLLNRN